MGIKDLNPFLKKTMKYRPAERQIPLTSFSGQPIAIDGHNWIYRHFMVSNKMVTQYTNVGSQEVDRKAVMTRLYNACLDTVIMFTNHGVVPVFVFDGDYPVEKAETQDKRRQERRQDRQEAAELQEKLNAMSPFDRSQEDITRLKQLLSRSGYLDKKEIVNVANFLRGLGVPVLQAIGDAEQLCASMAKEGLVSAVYSEDTDNLVYGCPVLITGFGDYYRDDTVGKNYRNVICTVLDDILTDFEWSHQTFIDFCITLGCDFNNRVKGLGPVTAFRLINEFKTIESFPDRYDTSSLKASRCREIFQHVKPTQVIDDDKIPVRASDLQLDKDLLESNGRMYLAESDYGDFSQYYWRIKVSYETVTGPVTGKVHSFSFKKKIIRI